MPTAPATLHALTTEAAALAAGGEGAEGGRGDPYAETARQLTICNACRYCEGYCAVFPAMTRRLVFTPADAHYLANLCHQCGACFHACQYAPPHEFAVNIPRVMARVRRRTYEEHAWPAWFGRAYRANGVTVALCTAGAITLFLLLALARGQALVHEPLAGNFYAVFPHGFMALLFGAAFGFSLLAMAIAGTRFWRGTDGGRASSAAMLDATHAAVALRYLDGGHGDGCNEADDAFTHARRRFHHLTSGGFALCFAATITATGYHYVLGEPAPYALTSVPVVLGTLGGLGLLAGPAGLMWLHLHRDARTMDAAQAPMDRAFILLLFAVSASGLALLVGRDGIAMATLLCVHLGFVLALFVTLPYGKFAHGMYRALALLKWAIERRTPNPVSVGND